MKVIKSYEYNKKIFKQLKVGIKTKLPARLNQIKNVSIFRVYMKYTT